jgi:hypothetical protein
MRQNGGTVEKGGKGACSGQTACSVCSICAICCASCRSDVQEYAYGLRGSHLIAPEHIHSTPFLHSSRILSPGADNPASIGAAAQLVLRMRSVSLVRTTKQRNRNGEDSTHKGPPHGILFVKPPGPMPPERFREIDNLMDVPHVPLKLYTVG